MNAACTAEISAAIGDGHLARLTATMGGPLLNTIGAFTERLSLVVNEYVTQRLNQTASSTTEALNFTLASELGGGSFSTTRRINYEHRVGSNWDRLATSEEYQRLASRAAMESGNVLGFLLYNDLTPVQPFAERQHYVWSLICYLAGRFLNQTNGQLDRQLLTPYLNEIAREYGKATLDVVTVFPIANTHLTDYDEVELGDGLLLQRLTSGEFSALHNDVTSGTHPYLRLPKMFSVRSAIREATKFKKCPLWSQIVDLRGRLHELSNLLPLALNTESVFIPAMVIRFPWQYRLSPVIVESTTFERPFSVVALDRALVEKLKHMLRLLRSSVNQEICARPLRRLQVSYDLGNQEDRLLDSWIGLESLFMHKDDSQDALRLRLSLRIGQFLGCDLVERKQIAKRAYQLYKIRSKVAHSDEPASEQDATDSRDLLLKSITQTLEIPKPFLPQALHTELLTHVLDRK